MKSWPAITALTTLVVLAMFSVYHLTKRVEAPPTPVFSTQAPKALLDRLGLIESNLKTGIAPGDNELASLKNDILALNNASDQAPDLPASSDSTQPGDELLVERLLSDLGQFETAIPGNQTLASPTTDNKTGTDDTALLVLERMQSTTTHLLATRQLLDESNAHTALKEQQRASKHGRWAFLLLGFLSIGLFALALQQWRGFRRQNHEVLASDIAFRDALEGLPDGCVVLNTDREVTAHNHNVLKLLPDAQTVDGANAASIYRELCHDSTINREALDEWLDNLHADSTSSIELLDHKNRHLLIRERPTNNGQITATIRDVSDTREAKRRLQEVTDYDSLTGLPNRALFMRELRSKAKNAESTDDFSLALMICDLREFRQINDSYGQETGDQLLIEIAACLCENMPEEATVARIAGDEFAVLVKPASDKALIEVSINQFLERLKKGFTIGNRHIPIRASLGISYGPEHGLSPVELKNTADSACSQAKRRSNSSFAVFNRKLQASAEREHLIDVGLLRAIESDELQIEYQPQIDIKTNLTAGMEALLRWDSPELGRVSPAEFIPRAEANGLIIELGDWVLHKAITDYQRLGKFVTATGTLSVNLSRKQFDNPELIGNIRRVLTDTGMPASELTLEITETAILDDRSHARDVLGELHCLGVNLSIDDFGVGYSSLLELRDFPINEVKIDRSFVIDVVECRNSRKIIQAIVSVADAIGAEVVAEGIETRAQFEWIQKLGCDRAQGYFLCEPMTATTFPDVVLGGRGDRTPA